MPANPREWITVLWPAFIAACMLEIVVFAAFDPHEINLFGWNLDLEPDSVYSLAFFAFWAVTSATGVVTWSLSRTSEQINRWQREAPFSAPLPGPPRNDDDLDLDPPESAPPPR